MGHAAAAWLSHRTLVAAMGHVCIVLVLPAVPFLGRSTSPPTPPCLTLCCPHPPCARLPQPGERAGSLRNPKLSTSWDKKMKAKAEEQAFKDAKRAALTARKETAAEEKRRREEAKVRAGGWHAGVGGTAVGWASISKQRVRRHGCRMPIGCAAASRACRLPCPSILLAVSPARTAGEEGGKAGGGSGDHTCQLSHSQAHDEEQEAAQTAADRQRISCGDRCLCCCVLSFPPHALPVLYSSCSRLAPLCLLRSAAPLLCLIPPYTQSVLPPTSFRSVTIVVVVWAQCS